LHCSINLIARFANGEAGGSAEVGKVTEWGRPPVTKAKPLHLEEYGHREHQWA
jgi:hypothetical protein